MTLPVLHRHRSRLVDVRDLAVGDAIRWEGTTAVVSAVRRSHDRHHWIVKFAGSHITAVVPGTARFTRAGQG